MIIASNWQMLLSHTPASLMCQSCSWIMLATITQSEFRWIDILVKTYSLIYSRTSPQLHLMRPSPHSVSPQMSLPVLPGYMKRSPSPTHMILPPGAPGREIFDLPQNLSRPSSRGSQNTSRPSSRDSLSSGARDSLPPGARLSPSQVNNITSNCLNR